MSGLTASANPRVVHGSAAFAATAPAVVVLGNFDGVHLGHQALLTRARQLAEPIAGHVVAYTFDPHPAQVLAPSRAPVALYDAAQKAELLTRHGADVVVIEPFTPAFARQSAQAFVDDILVTALGARAVVVGYDFTYGAGRSGNAQTLAVDGRARGVEVTVVAPVADATAAISSTRIRGHLGRGELPAANACLGRGYCVTGEVVTGKQRGRTLGFPTANVAVNRPLPLRHGVYACTLRVRGEGEMRQAVASLGLNPTFTDVAQPVLEVHVMNWEGDLYGADVEVCFWGFLRAEAKFDSLPALIAQMRLDVRASQAVLDQVAAAPEF